MLGSLLGPEIKEMIARRDFAGLRETFAEFPAVDAAELIAELPEEERAVVFRILPHSLAADVFEYLEAEAQQDLLKAMSSEQAAAVLNEMSPDDRTALLEELPGTAVAQLLTLLTPEERKVAQQLLNYPEGSVGRLMTPDFVSVRDDWTIQRVLDHIRQNGRDSETLNVVYVTDERGVLIDDIRIREFLLRPLETLVRDIHDASYVSLKARDDAETALETFKKYDRNTLPVTDSNGQLLGIVTVDDMLDVQEAEATEDIHKLGGTEALAEPYMDAPLWELVRKRVGWLIVLFLGGMLTATVIGRFQANLEKAVILTVFMPLIISAGGNAGSQASTLIIRAMSLGEVGLGDWWRVMRKEILSGLWLGGILAVIGFLRVVGWQHIEGIFGGNPYGDFYVRIGLTFAIAVLGVVLWGTIAGSMLPLILKRIGVDPATSSAPFVATLVDVTGLIIYFWAAVAILSGTLL
jgi:magnesium transporter